MAQSQPDAAPSSVAAARAGAGRDDPAATDASERWGHAAVELVDIELQGAFAEVTDTTGRALVESDAAVVAEAGVVGD